MKPTPYAKGAAVLIPPCRMHTAQNGIILSRHVMREIHTDTHKAITEYWIRFEDGETCLHPHQHVEMIGEQANTALMLAEVAA